MKGGSVTWKHTPFNSWVSSKSQEYSILEARLLNLMKVVPKSSCVSTNGHVNGLLDWWNHFYSPGCMNNSIHDILQEFSIDSLPEIISLQTDIVTRRRQDMDKLGVHDKHLIYLNTLDDVLEFMRKI